MALLVGFAGTSVLGCSSHGSGGPAASSRRQCQSIGLPAYVDFSSAASGTDSSLLFTAGSSLGFAVLNPASGPGTLPDSRYLAAIDRLTRRSKSVVGYVDTDYGRRPVNEVLADVGRWKSWYGVSSIFFDQAPTTTREFSRYERYVDAVHHNRGRALLNPGTYPDRSYLRLADVTVTFEGSYDAYRTQRRPSWAEKIDPAKTWHLIYGTPEPDLASALRLARARGAGFVYVTDDALPDPWNVLTTYWSDEQSQVADNGSDCHRPSSWAER